MINFQQQLNKIWYSKSKLYYFLLPFAGVFFLLSRTRKFCIHYFYPRQVYAVPVIVVGNLTAGGSGKTPMVTYLVSRLQEMGLKPGVVARGYKSKADNPVPVDENSQPADVGDEPLLIYLRTKVPVVVGRNRINNIAYMIDNFQCDFIVCDDGLQDYRFVPALKILMVDGERKFGNRKLLPAGPLRESEKALNEYDFVVATARPIPELSPYCMNIKFTSALKLNNLNISKDIKSWAGTTVHAVAGIGNPDRYFNMLENFGIDIIRHSFADHADFHVKDLTFNDGLPVLMTEKDAVKCRDMRIENAWFLPIDAIISNEFILSLTEKLRVENG
jgi:tetraacyldisaccharide 4'-kinase